MFTPCKPYVYENLLPKVYYQQLYAQAIQALDDNEQYWFDDNDVRQIMEHNRQLQVQSPVELPAFQYRHAVSGEALSLKTASFHLFFSQKASFICHICHTICHTLSR